MLGEMGVDSKCSSCPKPATQGGMCASCLVNARGRDACEDIGGYINRWKADPSLRAALKQSDGALVSCLIVFMSIRDELSAFPAATGHGNTVATGTCASLHIYSV